MYKCDFIRLVRYTRSYAVDKAPRFSIRRVIWILLSDTETSAATPPGVIQKKQSPFKLTQNCPNHDVKPDQPSCVCPDWMCVTFFHFFLSQPLQKRQQSSRTTSPGAQNRGRICFRSNVVFLCVPQPICSPRSSPFGPLLRHFHHLFCKQKLFFQAQL